MFSPTEIKVLKQITVSPISIKELVKLIYKKSVPLEAGNYIAGVVRRIKKKCIHNKLNWRIESSGGGRGGILVWKTKESK